MIIDAPTTEKIKPTIPSALSPKRPANQEPSQLPPIPMRMLMYQGKPFFMNQDAKHPTSKPMRHVIIIPISNSVFRISCLYIRGCVEMATFRIKILCEIMLYC